MKNQVTGRGNALDAEDSISYPVSHIANILLLTERRVQQLSKDGVIPKMDHGRYDLVQAVQGYIKYLQERSLGRPSAPEDYHTEKARLVKSQADKAELEVKTMRGELVEANAVASEWFSAVNDCKSRLLSIASKAAPILASESNAGACQTIIDDLVREALTELGSYANTEREEDNPEWDEGLDAASQVDGERLG